MSSAKRPVTSNGEHSFITVVPRTNFTDNPALRRFRIMQSSEKRRLQTVELESTGKPGGALLASAELEAKHSELLQELSIEDEYKPNVLHFLPVQESQLVKDFIPTAFYTKGSYVQGHELLYKIQKNDSRLVRSVLENVGFHYTDSHEWNVMWASSSLKGYLYGGLSEYQRINHFPSSCEITRKDKLCVSLSNMQEKHGRGLFDFIPETFLLPEEFAEFYEEFTAQKNSLWIVKPSCSSRGRGIYVVSSVDAVPLDDQCIISKYIHNPLLINRLKFDLRLYVVVTCFEPLRIYMYHEGLVRFASEPYDPAAKDKFVHLTNYSVNKKNERFIQNTDWQQDDVGHKWSLKALLRHFEAAGIDTDLLWSKIYDLIIKTLLSIEHVVVEAVRRHALNRNNCFELFGFDVLIDANLKPWLLEVNLSPSLATDSPLDLHTKSNLVADTLNLIGLRVHNRKKESMNKLKNRIRAKQNQYTARAKSANKANSVKPEYFHSKKFREIARDSLEEYYRKGNFLRIYPAKGANVYDQFFQSPRVVNKALYQTLYGQVPANESRAKPAKIGFRRPGTSYCTSDNFKGAEKHNKFTAGHRGLSTGYGQERYKSNNALHTRRLIGNYVKLCKHCSAPLTGTHTCRKDNQVYITRDEILIEYMSRLIHTLKALKADNIKPGWAKSIQDFVTHSTWQNEEQPGGTCLREMLENRLSQMRIRMSQSPIVVSELEKEKMAGTRISIKGYPVSKLEELLKASSKDTAQEPANCLIGPEGTGVLSSIIRLLATSNIYAKLKWTEHNHIK